MKSLDGSGSGRPEQFHAFSDAWRLHSLRRMRRIFLVFACRCNATPTADRLPRFRNYLGESTPTASLAGIRLMTLLSTVCPSCVVCGCNKNCLVFVTEARTYSHA